MGFEFRVQRLIAAVMIVGGCGSGSDQGTTPEDPLPPLPLAVIDPTTGMIVDEWEAPRYLVDVAVDHATGRVWGVAESTDEYRYDSLGAGIFELFPDRPPELLRRLTPLDPAEPERWFWPVTKEMQPDYGIIALDPIHRRGTFTSHTSRETVLIDLDSGDHVFSVFAGYYRHGNAFWTSGGIGYSTGGGYGWAFRSSDGALFDGELCSPDHYQLGVAISESRGELYVVQSAGLPTLCIVDLVTLDREFWPIPCNGLGACQQIGLAMHPDGRRLYMATLDVGSGVINTLGVLDVETRVLKETMVLARAHGVELSSDGTRAFATTMECSRIAVFDADTLDYIADIRTEGDTLGFDIDGNGRLLVAQARPFETLGGRVEDAYCPPLKPTPAGAVRPRVSTW